MRRPPREARGRTGAPEGRGLVDDWVLGLLQHDPHLGQQVWARRARRGGGGRGRRSTSPAGSPSGTPGTRASCCSPWTCSTATAPSSGSPSWWAPETTPISASRSVWPSTARRRWGQDGGRDRRRSRRGPVTVSQITPAAVNAPNPRGSSKMGAILRTRPSPGLGKARAWRGGVRRPGWRAGCLFLRWGSSV